MMTGQILAFLFTVLMNIGYAICIWSGLTGNISWMQSYSRGYKGGGHVWFAIGVICYLLSLCGWYFLEFKWAVKAKKWIHRHGKLSELVLWIPLLLLLALGILRAAKLI